MIALSEDTAFLQEAQPWARTVSQDPAFWMTTVHTPVSRLCVVIRAGCTAVFPISESTPGPQTLFLSFGAALPQISADGLDVTVELRGGAGLRERVFYGQVDRFDPSAPWSEMILALEIPSGAKEVAVSCGPGPKGDTTADWLALYELVIAPQEQIGIRRARTFPHFRTQNEISVCNHTYTSAIYTQAPIKRPQAPDASGLVSLIHDELHGTPVPDFGALLHRRIAIRKPVRILSLASGAARVENAIIRRVAPASIDLTLCDINGELLEQARESLLPHKVTTMVADVNRLELPTAAYDVVMCVSGAHHFVELERVFDAVSQSLAPGGEFWSIGEYVGRTGARLWPEAYEEANQVFAALPEKVRYNRSYQRVDTELPNVDCSLVSYESIRSEDLLPVILDRFTPEWMDLRSTITWRLLDGSYADNYNVLNPEDYRMVEEITRRDYELQQRGMRPVSLNGVFLPKLDAHIKG